MRLTCCELRAGRRGVTLLELLVTIGIILAITAAVIPVMQPAMATRRLREASRGVNTFLNAARNRALTSGHAVGVSFERLDAETQASTLLTMVEVPPPWSGDTTSSGLLLGVNGRILGFATRSPSSPTGFTPSGDVGWQIARVRPGDIVKLNQRGTLYRIYAGEVMQDADQDGVENGEWIDSDVDGNGQFAPSGSYNADASATDPQYGHFIKDPSQSIWTLGFEDPRRRLAPVNLAPGLYSFQIIRQPVKSSSMSFQLPVGVVVDLAVSSDDAFTHRFAELDPSAADDKRPVVVLFSPNGSVDRVWCPELTDQTSQQSLSFRPTSGLHFLIGRRDGVGVGPRSVANTPPDELPNWRDVENIWVSVNSQTGMIASNPNAVVNPNLLVRANDTTTDDTNVDAANFVLGLGQARAIARQGQSMGGR